MITFFLVLVPVGVYRVNSLIFLKCVFKRANRSPVSRPSRAQGAGVRYDDGDERDDASGVVVVGQALSTSQEW